MPKKKSVKLAVQNFATNLNEITQFLKTVSIGQDAEHISWLHNYAVIRIYKEFESMILSALVGAINNDSTILTERTGIKFPKHLTDEVCEYLIVGTGYFDFKGRDGLLKTLKCYISEDHYLYKAIKEPAHRDALNQLSALRNFAAHESKLSKKAALLATKSSRMSSSGAWLKNESRLDLLIRSLHNLALDLKLKAPY